MRVDTNGINFLRDVEGMKLVSYLDTGGVPTIGIGSTEMFGKPVKLGMKCTEAEAYYQCGVDLEEVAVCVDKYVKVPLTQNQFNSLSSFIYNVGIDAFIKSTLLRKLNVKDYTGAAEQFMRWIYDNGKAVDGLRNRRIKEKALFLKP